MGDFGVGDCGLGLRCPDQRARMLRAASWLSDLPSFEQSRDALF